MRQLRVLLDRLKASPLAELRRIARYGPRLYRGARRCGAGRREALWVALVPGPGEPWRRS